LCFLHGKIYVLLYKHILNIKHNTDDAMSVEKQDCNFEPGPCAAPEILKCQIIVWSVLQKEIIKLWMLPDHITTTVESAVVVSAGESGPLKYPK
jgi:hypothetical protein